MTSRVPAPGSVGGSTPRWVSTSARVRLFVMLAVAVAALLVTGLLGQWGYAPLCGWNAAALVFDGWVGAIVARMGASATARHATRENPGRAVSDAIVIFAAVASLAAVAFVLVQANSAQGVRQDLLASLAIVSVALSWFAIHLLFTLRYAHLYYRGHDGGIDFNQEAPPRYLDFAYVAFTLGMTFQVSDTDLRTSAVRSTALRQALLSYLFGAVILASMINLVAGLGGRGGG